MSLFAGEIEVSQRSSKCSRIQSHALVKSALQFLSGTCSIKIYEWIIDGVCIYLIKITSIWLGEYV